MVNIYFTVNIKKNMVYLFLMFQSMEKYVHLVDDFFLFNELSFTKYVYFFVVFILSQTEIQDNHHCSKIFNKGKIIS